MKKNILIGLLFLTIVIGTFFLYNGTFYKKIPTVKNGHGTELMHESNKNEKQETTTPQTSNDQKPQEDVRAFSKTVIEKKIGKPATYQNENAKFSMSYFPDVVRVAATYLPDLPRNTEEGPCFQFGQSHYYEEKSTIAETEAGSFCETEFACGTTEPMRKRSFCQIQTYGQTKGRMQIADVPVDGHWIDIRYTFYSGDYKIDISPYNKKCGTEGEPCGNFIRGDSVGEFLSIDLIKDSYLNGTELKFNLQIDDNTTEIIDFNKIMDAFDESLSSLQII